MNYNDSIVNNLFRDIDGSLHTIEKNVFWTKIINRQLLQKNERIITGKLRKQSFDSTYPYLVDYIVIYLLCIIRLLSIKISS